MYTTFIVYALPEPAVDQYAIQMFTKYSLVNQDPVQHAGHTEFIYRYFDYESIIFFSDYTFLIRSIIIETQNVCFV